MQNRHHLREHGQHVPLRLSIIVPVYNEERTLPTLLERLCEACGDFAQLIFVDDGSSDCSLDILRRLSRPEDTVLHKENGGKGSAVRLGLQSACAPYTIVQDADLEYDPSEIRMLLAHAEEHPGYAVFGSRFLRENPNLYRRYLWGNKLLTNMVNILFGGSITDGYTCYKLFPTEALRSFCLESSGFELEAELCAQALLHRLPIRELPIHYHPRSFQEGKKISLHDAWRGLCTLLRLRHARNHPSPPGTPSRG